MRFLRKDVRVEIEVTRVSLNQSLLKQNRHGIPALAVFAFSGLVALEHRR
jgi:hypothetical protein